MTAEYYAILAAGAVAGGFINGLAGFGTALFALGWWLQIMPPLQAVAMVLAVSAATGLQGLLVVRRDIAFRRLGPFLIPAFLGIPFGLMVLDLIDARLLKFVVAGFLILYGGFFILRRDLPSLNRPTPAIDAAIGFAGGFLGAVAGLSGALPTMWLAMRDWSKGWSRGVLQPFNVSVLGVSAALLAWRGVYDRETLTTIAMVLPVSFLSARVGIIVFRRLEDMQFRRLLIALMLLSGAIIALREAFA